MKPLLVGQAPSRTGDPGQPLSSHRIAALLGLRFEEYLLLTDRTNLIPEYPGRRPVKGDLFPLVQARERALQLPVEERHVLLFGRGVAAAFGAGSREFLERFEVRGGKFLLLPHFSGINRWWNSPANRTFAEMAARAWLKECFEAEENSWMEKCRVC